MNDYLRHLQDMEIRKDIRAREKEKDKGKEYKDFSWSDIITDGKLSKSRVRELDLYLTQHGLNTTGLKPDKVKAISCHYFRGKWLRTDGRAQGGEVISDGDESGADENETTSDDEDQECDDQDIVIRGSDATNFEETCTIASMPDEALELQVGDI